MKKAFIQKLSIAMATAMVITAAAPATADAAKKMGLNAKSKILYLNADNKSKTPSTFDFNITNKEKDYKKKYNFTWYADNESIVDVAKGGVVTALKPGKTVVKCDITTKKGKLKQTLEATVEVKANAKTVVIKNQPDGPMTVGTKFDFNRTMKNADGGKATDKTEWFVSADAEGKEATDVASIESNGMVTALKAGTFYVTAKTYQSAKHKDKGYTAVSEPVKVVVDITMTDVKLTKVDTYELTFDSSVKDIVKEAKDVKIATVASNKASIPVKAVKVSEDGKTVTVTSYIPFVNDVTYAITAAGKTAEHKAQIGKIASIVVPNQNKKPLGTTAVTDAPKIDYFVYDANGVDITGSYPIGGVMTVIGTSANGSYITDEGRAVLLKEGDVVDVKLKYILFDEKGNDLSIESNVGKVTCVKSTATSIDKWTISDKTNLETESYSDIKKSIKVEQSGRYLHVKANDNYDGSYTDEFTFTSLDESKLVVDAHTGKLTAIAAGDVTVKVESPSFVDYITITVNPKATYNSLVIDKGSATLSNSSSLSTGLDNSTFTFTMKDEYNDKFEDNTTATVKVLKATNAITIYEGTTDITANLDHANDSYTAAVVNGELKLKVEAVAGKTGDASFMVTIGGKTRTFTVTVKEPKGAVDYKVELSQNSDANYNGKYDSYKEETGKLKVYAVDAYGTKVSDSVCAAASGVSVRYEVKNAKNEVVNSGDYTDAGVTITTKHRDGYALAAGTYNVYVYVGPIVKTTSFEIESTKPAGTWHLDNKIITNAAGTIVSNLNKAFTVKVGDATVNSSAIAYVYEVLNSKAVSDTRNDNSTTLTWANDQSTCAVLVKKIIFTDSAASGSDDYYELTVNQTVTLKKDN